MPSNFKLYPSGFLGNSDIAQTDEIAPIQLAKKLFDNSPTSDANKYTASKEVVRLWALMGAGSAEVKTLEFKALVIQAALKAFGTASFMDWIELQQSNPNYTDNQSLWIDETISYVYGGLTRRVNSYAWLTVLKVGSGLPTKKGHTEVIKQYMLTNTLINPRVNSSMSDFIVQWCRKPGGIYDLLASLNILFGTR